MVEEFRPIEGYEGLYEVSNLGRVRSVDRWVNINGGKKFIKGGVLKPRPNKNGYLMVGLYKEGKVKRCYIHRLVAQAFIPNPENLPCVNHKDENPSNPVETNLEWCTQAYNINFGTHTERMIEKKSKKVQAFNKKGELVFEFPSTQEAERNGFDHSNISHCCLGKQKSAYGYVWKYA